MRFSTLGLTSVLLLAALLLTAPVASAQTPGTCAPGSAQAFLDVSDVRASLFTNGNLFFGGSTTSNDGYLVPKGGGVSSLFAAGLWVSGSVGGSDRVTASRYGNHLFRPGPLEAGATLPTDATCGTYDRIWTVTQADIQAYEDGTGTAADLLDWPVGLGAKAVDADGDPVVATSRDQTIDLAAGERPVLGGLQTAFWVMNDVAAPRSDAATDPLGVELRVTASVRADDAIAGIAQATLYQIEVVNRNGAAIDAARLSLFTDPDLGDASDDYVGTDTARNLAFVYGANDTDASYGVPPALGLAMLSGLDASSTFINGGPDGTQDPNVATEYVNYMRGLWLDGTPVTASGTGYQSGGDVTLFTYPGDPVTGAFWSEVNTDGNGSASPQGDRRLVATTALGTLAPGDTATVELAILFAQGADRFDSLTQLRSVSDAVQAAYDAGTLFQPGGELATLAAPVLTLPVDAADLVQEDSVTFAWEPVAGAESYTLEWGAAPGAFTGSLQVAETSVSRPARVFLTSSGVGTVYWRVTPSAVGAVGTPSAARSVELFRGGSLLLSDGRLAFVEVQAAGGGDPCVGADPDASCAEVGGDAVFGSLSAAGGYYLSSSSGTSQNVLNDLLAPSELEIRFTDTGSLAVFPFGGQGEHVIAVPFEVWDVGVVAPGEANDPSDDVQLIPALFADGGGTCAFNADERDASRASLSGYVESDRIYAYRPATTYAAYDAALRSSVEAAPDGCFDAENVLPTHAAPVSDPGARPLARLVIGSPESAPALPGTGTVIRFYTADRPAPVAAEDDGLASPSALRAVFPNPASRSATAPYRLRTAGAIRLTLHDVLGRELAVLADGRQLEGEHAAGLDASGLAAGVYVVRLQTGAGTHTARFTVVR